MNESAERIKRALDMHRQRNSRPLDANMQEFVDMMQKDIEKTVQDKYGDFVDIKHLPPTSDIETVAAMTAQEIRTKGYAYDSLCFRYRDARYKQAEAEAGFRTIGDEWERAKRQAERDYMRFCMILDDVIGEHD